MTIHELQTTENTMMNHSLVIRVLFPLVGTQLPADHGYALYSAISETVSALHQTDWLGVEMISGVPFEKGIIALPTKGASLNLRIPAERFGAVLPLAGKTLNVAGERIRLGIPTARPLQPAPALYARTVTIKGFTEPKVFLEAARRQLEKLEIQATLELPRDAEQPDRVRRRIVTVHGKRIVGFALVARELNDEDSLKLQSIGIGGRRSMGCGLFNPIAKIGEVF